MKRTIVTLLCLSLIAFACKKKQAIEDDNTTNAPPAGPGQPQNSCYYQDSAHAAPVLIKFSTDTALSYGTFDTAKAANANALVLDGGLDANGFLLTMNMQFTGTKIGSAVPKYFDDNLLQFYDIALNKLTTGETYSWEHGTNTSYFNKTSKFTITNSTFPKVGEYYTGTFDGVLFFQGFRNDSVIITKGKFRLKRRPK